MLYAIRRTRDGYFKGKYLNFSEQPVVDSFFRSVQVAKNNAAQVRGPEDSANSLDDCEVVEVTIAATGTTFPMPGRGKR